MLSPFCYISSDTGQPEPQKAFIMHLQLMFLVPTQWRLGCRRSSVKDSERGTEQYQKLTLKSSHARAKSGFKRGGILWFGTAAPLKLSKNCLVTKYQNDGINNNHILLCHSRNEKCTDARSRLRAPKRKWDAEADWKWARTSKKHSGRCPVWWG